MIHESLIKMADAFARVQAQATIRAPIRASEVRAASNHDAHVERDIVAALMSRGYRVHGDRYEIDLLAQVAPIPFHENATVDAMLLPPDWMDR